MKNYLTVLLLGILFPGISQEVVSTQGDSYSNANGSVDFTIGEVVINTVTNGSNDLTQGFHQTHWNFLGVDDNAPKMEAAVYPNPVGSELHISVQEFTALQYALTDASGRLIESGTLQDELTLLKVESLAPGAYQLVLTNAENQALKTFKLVKHQ